MKKQKVVVTGACGFVGSRLSRKLHDLGFEVFMLDNILSYEPAEGLHYICLDLVDAPTETLIKVFENSTIIHLAAIASSSECEKFPYLAISVNMLATKKVIDAANATDCTLIFASSEWVYPETSLLEEVDETTKVEVSKETNLYSVTKIVGEWLVQKYSRNYKILRFGIIYGERLLAQSAIENIVRLAITSQLVEIGSLDTARRFIHVDDICEGIVRCVGNHEKGKNEIFNLTGGELVSLGKIVTGLKKQLAHDFSIKVNETNPSVRNPNSRKLTEAFGWIPKITFEIGLQRLISWEIKKGES